jgi:hypothetical protein
MEPKRHLTHFLTNTFSSLGCVFLVVTVTLSLTLVQGQVSHVTLGPFVEQQKAGVMVGSVAQATNIASEMSGAELNTLRYEFLDRYT